MRILRAAYIPSGFSEGAIEMDGDVSVIHFVPVLHHNKEEEIVLTQYPSFQTSSITVDREDAVIEHIDINGIPGEMVLKNGHVHIVWGDEPCFELEGWIEPEELIKLAQSVQ